MDLGLKGKVVLVTGASGGIGDAVAEAFAAEGARLVLHGHRNFAAMQTRATERWSGDHTLLVKADVSDPVEIQSAIDQAVERFGRIDVCVANAGIWSTAALRLDEMPAKRVRQTLDVNLLGAAWTARAFMRALARTGPRDDDHGASILFVGSTAGRFGEKGHVDYAISKAGLYGLVRSLKNEIVTIDPRARVNMVEPGWTLTEMARPVLEAPQSFSRAVRTMPLRQIACAEDIALAVVFLSSPTAAGHISGEILTIAGGMEGRVQWEPHEVDADAIRRRLGLE